MRLNKKLNLMSARRRYRLIRIQNIVGSNLDVNISTGRGVLGSGFQLISNGVDGGPSRFLTSITSENNE
jgi:hypothetical protein